MKLAAVCTPLAVFAIAAYVLLASSVLRGALLYSLPGVHSFQTPSDAIEYDALGIVNRNVPGFESASRALQSVTPQEQLARRDAEHAGPYRSARDHVVARLNHG